MPSSVANAASVPARRSSRIRSGVVPTNTFVAPAFVGMSPAAAWSPYIHS